MRTHRRGFTSTDLFVVLLILLLAGTASIAQIVMKREQANRIKCASNLHQIGIAILLYENDNRGKFPRTMYDPAAADKPVWGTGNATAGAVDPFKNPPEKPNDVSAALFLLLRTENIQSGTFVCPSTTETPWDYAGGTAMQFVNWPAAVLAKHLSYSVANPYPSKDAVLAGFRLDSSASPSYAIAADINPGVIVSQNAVGADGLRGNSPNHNREAQNVLYGDGHVELQTTPYCGVQHDNIYGVGGAMLVALRGQGGTPIGSPVDATDSVLLPVAQGQAYDGSKGADVVAYSTTRASYVAPQPVTAHALLGHTFVSKDGLTVRFVSPNYIDWIRPNAPIASGNVLMTAPDRLRINLILRGDSVVTYFRIRGTINVDLRQELQVQSLVSDDGKLELRPE